MLYCRALKMLQTLYKMINYTTLSVSNCQPRSRLTAKRIVFAINLADEGSTFQARAAAIGKVWSPSVERRVEFDSTISVDIEVDRRRRRTSASVDLWNVRIVLVGIVPVGIAPACRNSEYPHCSPVAPTTDSIYRWSGHLIMEIVRSVHKSLQAKFLCTVWVKKIHPLRDLTFFIFFTNGWEFLIDFLHTYYTLLCTVDHKFLFNYLPTLTKLCHIKRDYQVHIVCSKCPPSAETHAFRRLRKFLIALLIVVCGKSL